MPAKKTARKTVAAEPKAAKTAKKKTAPRKTAARAKKSGPSTDEIATAAYLNYRKRIEHGIPGNHESDWIQAEQELSGDS